MPNLGEFKDAIYRQLNRNDSNMVDEVAYQIVEAIKHYASQRFQWNHKLFTFNTSDSVELYNTIEDFVDSTEYGTDKIVSIDSQFVVVDDIKRDIDKVDFDWQGYGSTTTVRPGRPQAIAHGLDGILVIPVPNDEYEIRMSGILDINTLTIDSLNSAESPWLDRAEKMIRAKVLSEIYKFYLHNLEMGLALQNEANAEFHKLVQDQERLAITGRIWGYGEPRIQGFSGYSY